MSNPTPGSDPDYPQGGASPGQPEWGAPQQPAPGYTPAPSYSDAPAGYGAPATTRPGQVTAAAVIGIVIGALGTLGGLISLFGLGPVFAFDAFLGILVLLSFAAALFMLIAGIQAIQGKSPRILLLASYASIGVQLLYLLWSLISGWGFTFFGLLGFILPGIIVFLLRQPQARQYYATKGMTY